MVISKESREIRRLKKIIERKDREILDIKMYCKDEFLLIAKICKANEYGGQYDKSAKLRKILENSMDNANALATDIKIELDSTQIQSSSKEMFNNYF